VLAGQSRWYTEMCLALHPRHVLEALALPGLREQAEQRAED